MAAGATFEPIATTTVAVAASTITFSSIASTYTDLRLILTAVSSTLTPGVALRFNGDSASNYSNTRLTGNGASAASSRSSNDTSVNMAILTGLSTTIPTLMIIDIFSYAGSTYKTVLSNGNFDMNGSGSTEQGVALWRSTSAINTVALTAPGSLFGVGTTATLYGIKAA